MRSPTIRWLLLAVLLPALALSDDVTSSDDVTGSDPVGHLKPFGEQGPKQPIDSVDGFLPPKEFIKNYVLRNRPLLFKGAAKASPAFEKWTDAYLAEKTPPRPAGDVFVEHKKKENRSQGYSYLHFKEFLQVYNTSDIYMVAEVPPYLLQDLVVPFPLQCKSFVNGGLDTHVVWFSSGGTSSVIHHDNYENINCLLRGRKTLVFLNISRYPEEVDNIIDTNENGYSTADVDSIDVKARPEFAGLEFHHGVMETGDCLYIPNLWLHQVRSFENNLAVNLWWFAKKKYDLTGCAKQFDPNLRFNKVRFTARIKEAKEEAESVREVLAFHLKPPVSQADFLNFLSRGDLTAVEAARPEFPSTVDALFKALDVNGDGQLTADEFEVKITRKLAAKINKAVSDYNIQVFAMHQAAESSGLSPAAIEALPKLLATNVSDDKVFAPHRTWQIPNQGPEKSDGEDGDSANNPESGKDEL